MISMRKGDIKLEMLMPLATNKFKTRKVAQIWNEQSPEEEKILALKTQLSKLEKAKEPNKPKKDKSTKKDAMAKGKGHKKPDAQATQSQQRINPR